MKDQWCSTNFLTFILVPCAAQGYWVLHADVKAIPKPKKGRYKVREGLSQLFSLWSMLTRQAFPKFHATDRESELRPTPRLDALLFHTYESSTSLLVGLSGIWFTHLIPCQQP